MREIHEALGETAGRVTELLCSVERPDTPAVGDWTIADTAAHLHEVSVVNTFCAAGVDPPDELRETCEMAARVHIDEVSVMNALSLARAPERDLRVLAYSIGGRVERLLAETATADGTEQVAWLGGMKLPLSAVIAHMLSELLVHGHDIARAARRPFPIPSVDAGLVFEHFLLAMLANPDMGDFAGERREQARPVSCELRLRGSRRALLVADEGGLAVREPGDVRPDICISADPAAMLLVLFDRTAPLVLMLRGRLVMWGRRPWRLPRLMRLMQSP
jgi:hypothetical protein